jgi:hypothetical protein
MSRMTMGRVKLLCSHKVDQVMCALVSMLNELFKFETLVEESVVFNSSLPECTCTKKNT